MGTRLKGYEIEGPTARRQCTPLDSERDSAPRDHAELSQDWAEVEGLLRRPGPAWAELRSLLNELNGVLGR